MHKHAFFQIKGFGDLLVLMNFLKFHNNHDTAVVVTKRNLNLLSFIGYDGCVEVVDFKESTPSFYSLRKSLRNLVSDVVLIRNTAKLLNKRGYKCILDFQTFRNRLIFFGLDVEYLPVSHSIYESYALFFDTNIHHLSSHKGKTVGIFPFGSTKDRHIPNETLSDIVSTLKSKGYEVKLCVHITHLNLVKDIGITNSFDSFESFENILTNIDLLITVDSMALHWAYGIGLPTYVLSNSWKRFIPLSLLKERFFRMDEYNSLLSKIK
jgi:hypothetical protein